MNEANKSLNIAIEIEKGTATLRQAQILFDNQEYDGCISRAYYAVFHYATAVLFTRGLEVRSHEGLVRLFNLHFIKTAAFPKKFSTILSHAQKAREESDYRPEIPFTEDDAALRLREAREFIVEMDAFLKKEGFRS